MKIPLAKYVWFDGRLVTIDQAQVPITTHAIHYGTSVFEGVRAYWSLNNLYIFRIDEHLRRFRDSGAYYSMSLNFSNEELKEAMIQLCRKNEVREHCYIRPFYFIGQYGINLHVTADAPTHAAMCVFSFSDLFDKNGISACITSWRKFSSASTPTQAKMGGNYLNSIIATIEAKNRGFDEAILLDLEGHVSESPGENIFIIKDGRLLTPPVGHSALKGITRDTILEMAKDAGYDTSVQTIDKQDLYAADEVFLCGTAAEITPVTGIDGEKIGTGRPGPVTQKIMDAYDDVANGRNMRYSRWLTEVY